MTPGLVGPADGGVGIGRSPGDEGVCVGDGLGTAPELPSVGTGGDGAVEGEDEGTTAGGSGRGRGSEPTLWMSTTAQTAAAAAPATANPTRRNRTRTRP